MWNALELLLLALLCLAASGKFSPEVEWKCSDSVMEVLVHTARPFFGLVHPKGRRHSNCTFHGNGQNTTRIRIPLNGTDESVWEECGLHLEVATSTLWTQLEVHEHPQLILHEDRLVNTSCVGWTDSLEQRSEGNSQFKLIVRQANQTGADQMAPTNRLQLGDPYELVLIGPVGQQVRVHSCDASSADRSVRVQLINAKGCPLDLNLMAEFVPSSPQSSSSSSPSPPANSSPPWTARAALATSKLPSMFRFNSASSPRAADLVRFECNVEVCGEQDQKPCESESNCESRRTRQKPVDEPTEPEEGELELVTQLLGSGSGEEVPEEKEATPTNASTDQQPMTITSETAASSTWRTTLVPVKNVTEKAGPLVKVRNNASAGIGGWHRVRTMVRVLDTNRGGRQGWVNNSGGANSAGTTTTATEETSRSSSISSTTDGTSTDLEQSSQAVQATTPAITIFPRSEHRIRLVHASPSLPLFRDFPGTSPSTSFSSPPPPSSSTSSPSACVTPEQLLRLYQICIALCAVFLLGCFCNLFLCCFNRRSEQKLHSPLRAKRGRRQHSVLIASAPLSNSTLTSSLYGPGNVLVSSSNGDTMMGQKKDKNGTPKMQQQQQNGFWISGEGRENAGGGDESADHFAPMMSSIYGALPQPPASASNRRSSIHSYASVKAPHSTQQQRNAHQLLSSRLPTAGIGQQLGQGHELVQQSSLSPAHSPSTTTSSSGGGASQNGQLMSRTFHPQPQQQQFGQKQAPSSLASSSVRSSTLGTPSPSETEPAGTSTPRPLSEVVPEDGHNQQQQQLMNSSTFGRPTHSFLMAAHPMRTAFSQHNESFSAL